MIKRLEHLSCERSRDLMLFRLEKAQGEDLINAFKYLMGRSEADGAWLFSVIPRNRKKGTN